MVIRAYFPLLKLYCPIIVLTQQNYKAVYTLVYKDTCFQNVVIDRELEVGTRVTVRLESKSLRKSTCTHVHADIRVHTRAYSPCIHTHTHTHTHTAIVYTVYPTEGGRGGGGERVLRGEAVAPSVPRREAGLYWGYTVRLADSFSSVFTDSPHQVTHTHTHTHTHTLYKLRKMMKICILCT